MKDREVAYLLYKAGVSKTDISRIFRKSPNTVTRWAKEDNWEEKSVEEALFKETSGEQVRELITYQLKVLNKIKDIRQDDLQNSHEVADLRKLLIDKGDIDALSKLYATIKGKEIEFTQITLIVKELVEYVERERIELAKELTPLAHEFIQKRMQS